MKLHYGSQRGRVHGIAVDLVGCMSKKSQLACVCMSERDMNEEWGRRNENFGRCVYISSFGLVDNTWKRRMIWGYYLRIYLLR